MLAPLFRTVLAVATLAAGDYVSSATLPMTTRTPAALEPAFVQPGARGVLGNLNPGLHLRRDGVCSLSCHGAEVRNKKKTLYAPATSRLGWREYRSRLIHAETPGWMRRLSQETGVWAHEVPMLEHGCLLVETGENRERSGSGEEREGSGSGNGEASEGRVVLLLSHCDKEGSRGLILNKATLFTIGDFTCKLPLFKDVGIHYGGDGPLQSAGTKDRELYAVHSCRDVLGSKELVDGVFLGADVKDASKVVGMGRARASDFKFFFSAVHWEKGQLKAEVEEGKWVTAACSKELILKPPSYWQKPLWRLVLELMGGKFALISRYLSAEL